MMILFFIILLTTSTIQSVIGCVQFEDSCCPKLVPKLLPSKFRFNNDLIFYTEPVINYDENCNLIDIDCSISGLESEFYNLLYTDANGLILNEKKNPIPSIYKQSLTCAEGYRGAKVYLTCEQGCTEEICDLNTGCACPRIKMFHEHSELIEGDYYPNDFYYDPKINYNGDCKNIVLNCPSVKGFGNPMVFVFLDAWGKGWLRYQDPLTPSPSLKCENGNWYYNNQLTYEIYITCAANRTTIG